MGLVDDVERRLERVLEGFFAKAFRSHIQPAEIGRRLLREMEAGKRVSVGAVYVPNIFAIRLAERDQSRLEGLVPALQKEFADLVTRNAKDRRWRPAGPIDVRFEADPTVREGQLIVEASHEAGATPQLAEEPSVAPQLRLRGSQPPIAWTLDSGQATIGRLHSCQVAVDDPNVSRRHAQITRRDDGWWIVDLGSTNGTLVNDALIKERRLAPGDQIRVGTTEFEYRSGEGQLDG